MQNLIMESFKVDECQDWSILSSFFLLLQMHVGYYFDGFSMLYEKIYITINMFIIVSPLIIG